MVIRRINLYAGPCAGKSMTAMWLAAELNARGHNVELVTEFVKSWAWTKKAAQSFDYLFQFAHQLSREDEVLSNSNYLIITDSPLLLNVYYSRRHGFPGWNNLRDLTELFDRKFPSLNIFLDRNGIPYKKEGRYENKDQALQIDLEVKSMLSDEDIPFYSLLSKEKESILELLLSEYFV